MKKGEGERKGLEGERESATSEGKRREREGERERVSTPLLQYSIPFTVERQRGRERGGPVVHERQNGAQ